MAYNLPRERQLEIIHLLVEGNSIRSVERLTHVHRDTSHVERHNLNIRTFLRWFTRLALGFSKKLEKLCAIVALCVAHYNFCRRHGTLWMTPAMKAGLTGHPWTLEELLTEGGAL